MAAGEGGIDEKCISTVRLLAVDVVNNADSGHPGAPMGCAPIAHVLWTKAMRYDPAAPKWMGRDRFVLSNGHACALLYSMLHLTGYDKMSMEDLKQFRQVGSVTAGHPENELHPAVEVSTGPLGQGISNAVGLAIAQKHLAAEYGEELFDNKTWVLCGDGCLQEGVSSEACSLAGHLGLGNLIVLYDDNAVTIDGSTDLSFTEDVQKRYEAYGWQVLAVPDGDSNLAAIEAAIEEARADKDRPTLIKVKTTIGFGAAKAGTGSVHGAPLGAEEAKRLKAAWGFDPDKTFDVPEDVAALYKAAGARGAAAHAEWDAKMAAFATANPDKAAELDRRIRGALPDDWESKVPSFGPDAPKDATRNLSGKVLNALAEALPEIMGGSADLTPSNKTLLAMTGDFQKDTPKGRYLRFGVREHGMTAICNGLAAYGAVIPFAATFLNFIGYAAGAARVTALSHFRVIFVATHDSIGLGEDGPTHQPTEMLLMLRGMPNMAVYRPADGNEVSAAYVAALRNPHRPAVIALSRQSVPHIESSSVESALRGAYVVEEVGGAEGEGAVPSTPDLVLIGTGTEVSLAREAAATLAGEGKRVRVVSMPCQEDFLAQSAEYHREILPEGVPTVACEALTPMGWERFSHSAIGVRGFGLSGPGPAVYEALGVTSDKLAERARTLLTRFKGVAPPLPIHFADDFM